MSTARTRYLTVRAVAIVMALLEIAIHADLAPSTLTEVPYIGVLFVVAIVLLIGVVISLLLRGARTVGWLVGASVCAGMFVAFVLSRTVGLPKFHESWTSDGGLGIVSLPPELIFIAAAAHAIRVRRAGRPAPYPVRAEDRESHVDSSRSMSSTS